MHWVTPTEKERHRHLKHPELSAAASRKPQVSRANLELAKRLKSGGPSASQASSSHPRSQPRLPFVPAALLPPEGIPLASLLDFTPSVKTDEVLPSRYGSLVDPASHLEHTPLLDDDGIPDLVPPYIDDDNGFLDDINREYGQQSTANLKSQASPATGIPSLASPIAMAIDGPDVHQHSDMEIENAPLPSTPPHSQPPSPRAQSASSHFGSGDVSDRGDGVDMMVEPDLADLLDEGALGQIVADALVGMMQPGPGNASEDGSSSEGDEPDIPPSQGSTDTDPGDILRRRFPVPTKRRRPAEIYFTAHPRWFVRITLIVIAFLHFIFHLPFAACDVLLFTLSIIFHRTNLLSDNEPMPTTFKTVVNRLELRDPFHILPMCPTCSYIFVDPIADDMRANFACPRCQSAVFTASSSMDPFGILGLFKKRTKGRKLSPKKVIAFQPITSLVSRFLERDGMVEKMDAWRTRDRSDPNKLEDMMDGRVWKDLKDPKNEPFFGEQVKDEVRIGLTVHLDW